MIIFYSWQSDLPLETNKTLIKHCLSAAIQKLNQQINIVDANRADAVAIPEIELDHDTKGVLGIPDLAATILSKIEKSDVFLADVTFTGRGNHNDKLYPNSNVLFELGYALGKLGDEQIILVMDTAHGAPDWLPFDLRHKRHPVLFNSKALDLSKEKASFTNRLFEILSAYREAHKPQQSAPVELQLKLQYRKEHMQAEGGIPAIRSRTFKLNFLGTNKTIKTLRNYSLEISVPKPIVSIGNPNQTGRRIDEPSDPEAVIRFPISQDKPLPQLEPGRKMSMTEIWCHVSERNLDFKNRVLEGQIKVALYGDGILPMTSCFQVRELDPFRLMDIRHESREYHTEYELEPIGLSEG